MSAAALHPIDYPKLVRTAAGAGILTLVLASFVVGIETISSTGALTYDTRFRAVICAAIGVAIVYFLVGMLKAGRPVPALLGGAALLVVLGGLTWAKGAGLAVGELVPFASPVINWGVMLVPASLVLRAIVTMGSGTQAEAESRSHRRSKSFGEFYLRYNNAFAVILIVAAVLLPFTPIADRRLIDVATLVLTYIMLGWGLNVVVGLAGLLDLGYVAFYAVGAYSYAMLSVHFGLSFWLALPLAGALAASFGLLLGFPVLRLRGDYLAIVTLGFGEMIRVIIINWWWFTGGPNGINKVARPSFFGLGFERTPAAGEATFSSFFGIDYTPNQRVFFLYFVILAFALLTNFFTLRIRKLPIGRAWEALREDETACRALGINPRNTKLTAFAIGAMFAGMAGSFFAARQGFVSPESFVFLESAVILAIVVLGGLGSQIGIVLAAAVLIGLPEFFRQLQDYRMLAFGIGMVLIMIWRPGGLLAHRDPTIFLNKGKTKQ
ncbi:MAG TPA: high-affinity branched-chain amino acid ABC transporter permease LivM [Dongiaceae bacterium]|jgi:branched-chain amino acid transport system permease protein|nr:high-affinity branched-chain amino acid ABC transporter permease LivM [Dongiaceae bacterium]